MEKLFASYEKETTIRIEKTTHRVRMRIGQSLGELMDTLSLVPKDCTVNEIIGDQEHEYFRDCGEIVFIEDKEVG